MQGGQEMTPWLCRREATIDEPAKKNILSGAQAASCDASFLYELKARTLQIN
jgi:hypothetical protein